MSKNYALVNKETKVVEDTVMWDGESWLPDEYFLYDIILADSSVKGFPVSIGSIYSQELNGFVAVQPPEVEKHYLDTETLTWKVLPEFRISEEEARARTSN